MGRSTKDAWLDGPGDLQEADVEDVPVKGQSVRVRGLPAAYSNRAQNEATELKIVGKDQIVTINKAKLEAIQFHYGVIEPQFSIEEAERIAEKYGPAFNKIIAQIDELSAVDKEAIDEANARFQSGGTSSNGADLDHDAPTGSGGPPVPARAGARAGDAGGGDV